mmetsp:Transcript_18573/g.37748  ORF Transcript_18573/g.37748 Transcript_18573/m.37748 type:complete len:172 (+) Transcript_18573:85-600(+)
MDVVPSFAVQWRLSALQCLPDWELQLWLQQQRLDGAWRAGRQQHRVIADHIADTVRHGALLTVNSAGRPRLRGLSRPTPGTLSPHFAPLSSQHLSALCLPLHPIAGATAWPAPAEARGSSRHGCDRKLRRNGGRAAGTHRTCTLEGKGEIKSARPVAEWSCFSGTCIGSNS